LPLAADAQVVRQHPDSRHNVEDVVNGLRLKDLAEGRYLAFDLKEILAVLELDARNSRWLCTELWCIPFGAPDEQGLEDRYNTGTYLTGEELTALAAETRQVVDGRFRAFRGTETEPWLIVRAVDSSFWEVFSTEQTVLDRLRAQFKDVVEIASDAA
jgi:hypothetical protein